MKQLGVVTARLLTTVVCSLMCLCWQNELRAQTQYDLSLTDIISQRMHRNWLRVPTAADLRVIWAVTARETSEGVTTELLKDVKTLPFVYKVYLYRGDAESEPLVLEVRQNDYADFPKLKLGETVAFKVEAYDRGALVADSDQASVVVGKGQSGVADGDDNRSIFYYMNPGRWQLATIGKANIYDRSTALGKLAFMFLSVTSMISVLILVFYSSRTLYLGNVFPFRRSGKHFVWSLMLSCDVSYEKRLTNKFKFVMKAWEMIAAKSKMIADQAVKSIPNALSSTEKMASVDVACMEYWTNDGDRAIATIEDIISYPENNGLNGRVKSPDDLLTELVIKIEDNFHDLVTENTNGKHAAGGAIYNHAPKEDMKALIEEIYEPVVTDAQPLSRVRKWVLRKGVLELKRGLRPFPTSRIIHAGLSIHRMNGYRWFKPTEEVKGAFEDRASNEIEALKRKSKIEWFWNYGALAPLVGLFGTVTGITYAFQQLSKTSGSPDFVNTIQMLSNGIFEALWTTIFGLANGIVFVIIYYYFKHKLDWIYAKWEEMYVTITEKL